jgi:hypothetical protein
MMMELCIKLIGLAREAKGGLLPSYDAETNLQVNVIS